MKYSRTIKNFLFNSGLMKLARIINRKRGHVAILRYHAIVNPKDCYYASPSICLDPALFEEQMAYISDNYNVITLDEIYECIVNKNSFPPHAVVLTFDDGYMDNYHAAEIMKRFGLTGTFYIAAECMDNIAVFWLFEVIYLLANTGQEQISLEVENNHIKLLLDTSSKRQKSIRDVIFFIKSNNLEIRESIRDQLIKQTLDVKDFELKASQVMLTWEKVKTMHRWGMTIGAHTLTHLNLPNAEPKDAFTEIHDCKKLIENQIGAPVHHFSYPNGGGYDYFNSQIIEMVKQSGYQTATTSINGLSGLKSDLFKLQRIRVTESLSEIIYQIDCDPFLN